jgi:hypothetical protein
MIRFIIVVGIYAAALFLYLSIFPAFAQCNLEWGSVVDADDYDVFYGVDSSSTEYKGTTTNTNITCTQLGISDPFFGYVFGVRSSNDGGQSSVKYVTWRKPYTIISKDIFKDLDSSTTTHTTGVLAKPGYLTYSTDPTFNTRIIRITDDSGNAVGGTGLVWTDVSRHFYSKVSPWSAEDKYIMLITNFSFNGGHNVFLDGSTYEVLFARDIGNTGYGNFRWHPQDPETAFFTDGAQLKSVNVLTGVETVEGTLPRYTQMDFGNYEGNFTRDGTKVALWGNVSGTGDVEAFVYDLTANTQSTVLDLGLGNDVDWVSITPGGEYVLIEWISPAVTRVYNLNMQQVAEYRQFVSHQDIGYDHGGKLISVGYVDGPLADEVGHVNLLTFIPTTEYTPLHTGEGLWHSSMRNTELDGWIYSSIRPDMSGPYQDEIITVSARGGTVFRWGHMHSTDIDYFAEPHPSPSRDGTRVLFASSWDESDGRPVSTYVVEMP